MTTATEPSWAIRERRLNARVAELSADVLEWRDRAMIAEGDLRRAESRLLSAQSWCIRAERDLRDLRSRSVLGIAWDRLRARFGGAPC
jgi:hypothetical protein